jgi:hypothetical protein
MENKLSQQKLQKFLKFTHT